MPNKFNLTSLTILCFIFIIGTTFGENYKEDASTKKIEQAYEDGSISLGDKYYYDVINVLAPEQLPDKFQSSILTPIKCATPLINTAIDNIDLMSGTQKAAVEKMLVRPPLDSVYYSPSGYFAIHYTFAFPDSVPEEDLDMSGVSDWVERAAEFADSAYNHYCVNLGYLPPPTDADGIYDIYAIFLGTAYGATFKENPGDSSWNDYQSHIRINSDFSSVNGNEDPEGKVIGALKVTVAHEFYHAVQMAYNYLGTDDLWWVEGGATFFENVVYTEVNDNYAYLPYFFNYPDSFLFDTASNQSFREYGTFVFQSYLDEKFDIEIMHSVWDYLRFYSLLPSLDSALAAHGTKFKTILPEFFVWNYFTGSRAIDGMFYSDAEFYPTVPISKIQNIDPCPFFGVTPTWAPDGVSCNYLMSTPMTEYPGLLYLAFDGTDMVEWSLSYVGFYGSNHDFFYNCKAASNGETDCGLYDYTMYDSLLFVPSVVSKWHNNNSYTFNTFINSFGDVNGNGLVNILDVTYLVAYLYKGGPAPKYDERMGDANCNGDINIIDVTKIIAFLYKDGPAPCE